MECNDDDYDDNDDNNNTITEGARLTAQGQLRNSTR
jgi:hypothetical protein